MHRDNNGDSLLRLKYKLDSEDVIIGSRARVSEVMTGQRSLTLAMIRRVRSQLGIPADLLIGPQKKHRKRGYPEITSVNPKKRVVGR